jgi:O-antigen/teichoic acid export membrane protein
VLILVPLIDVMALSILRARQRFGAFSLQRLSTTSLLLGGLGVGLVWARGGLSVAVGVYVVSVVLSAGLSLFLVGRDVPLKLGFDRQLTGTSLQFGLKSYLQNLVGRLNYRLDMYLLAFLLAPEQVAFYGVATSVAEVAWYIPNSVGVVLFPRLSNAPIEEIHEITARVCRNTLLLTALIAVGLLATGWLVVPLVYGPAYDSAIMPLFILLPGVLSMAVYKVLTRNFTSRDRQQVSILAAVLALVLNVGLDWTLIPRWSVVGAATASTVGYTAAGGVLLAFFLRDSGLSWRDVLVPKMHELAGYWRRLTGLVRNRLGQVRSLRGPT